MERKNSQRSADARGKSPEETAEQARKREDKLLEAVGAIRALRAQLSLAFGRPYPEPAKDKTHWDYLLEEMQWLHKDFAQVPSFPLLAPWSTALCSKSHQNLLILLVPLQASSLRKALAAALAARSVPATQHACCSLYCSGRALGALRTAMSVYACCMLTGQSCAGEIVEAGCSALCRHGSGRCCQERQPAEDACGRRHAG